MATDEVDTGELRRFIGRIRREQPGATSAQLVDMANRAAEEARNAAPVGEPPGSPRPGALRDSIRVEIDSPTQVVVLAGDADAYYVGHVEYGTSRQDPQPFMRPAAAGAEGNLEGEMGAMWRKLLGV